MGNQKFEKFLISDDIKVVDAMRLLSTLGCKVLFVHKDFKLIAALTDGDIRRYILNSGDINNDIKKVANYKPKYLINASKKEAENFMHDNLIDAVPIVDDENRIINIFFNNYKYKSKQFDKIDLPVVMMAGGKGTRLYPYTKVLPKPLIPVGDIPIAERIINQFYDFGCKDFYLIVNHMKNMIKSYFNEIEKPYNIHFIDEDEPLGTGGGVYYLKGLLNKTFILTNCDILLDCDFSKVFKFHQDNKNIITMIVAAQSIQVPYGVVEFDKNNRIVSMKEKPKISYYTNTGCYIVEPNVIEYIKEKENIGFPDIVEKCKNDGFNVGVYTVTEDLFIDIGEMDKLYNANEVL